MAKTSKTTTSATEKKSPAKPAAAPQKAAAPAAKAAASAPAKTAAKKAPAKKAAPAPAMGMPQIDTGLAAQSAATMLLNRDSLANTSQGKAESSTFKQMKDQLAKPKPAGLSHILGTAGDQKKGPTHFMNQQRGHNQTSGGFNKTGVPRRTNG